MTHPILMISYEAPPRLSAESILVGKTLKALSACFQTPPVVDLICALPGIEVPEDLALNQLIPENVRVHSLEPIPGNRKTLIQTIIGSKGAWQKSAESKGAALFPAEHKKPALVYSRSHPPHSHLAALNLLSGPLHGVPWIAHFSDPWSQHAYYKSPVTRAALRRYENQVFAAASRLVFVSERLRDTMLEAQPDEIKAKAAIMPHVLDADLFAAIPATGGTEDSRVLAHIGDLYGLRTPQPLFAAMGKLKQSDPNLFEKLKLRLVGRFDSDFESMAEENGIAPNISRVPPVPYFESLAQMKSADVLLAVEAPAADSVFFPSKLIDYLGAGKPILAITPKEGVTSKLMARWQQHSFDNQDIDGIAACLKKIAAGELWAPPANEIVENYKAQTIVKTLADMIKELAGI